MNRDEAITFDSLPELLTAKDLQKLLRISSATVYKLFHTEGFPVLRIGRKYLVPEAALREWIYQNSGLVL